MPCYVGLDTAKRTTSICVIDETDLVVKEGVVETDPKAINNFLRGEGRRYSRVGMEVWDLAPWLYAGLARSGLPIICIETRHSSSLLKSKRSNKTDRNDARGIAEIMRGGLYKAVHVKSVESQQARAVLVGRRFLRAKATDTQSAIRGTLLAFGHKLAPGQRTTFERRVRGLIRGDQFLQGVVNPLLSVLNEILAQLAGVEKRLKDMAQADPVCRRLMTAPGIGPITSLVYRTTIDEPNRFQRSRDVAAHLGLTPKSNQSGERAFQGQISKHGDSAARSALVMAARTQLRACTKSSWLKVWAKQLAARRGALKALVAVARRLAVVLHRMWVTETDFRWTIEPTNVAGAQA